MDKARYVEEGVRQLSQNKYYRKIESPVHTTAQETVNKIVDHIQLKKFLTKKQAEHLKVPHNPRERRFYLLPKVHKDRSKWAYNHLTPPGRPIVSDCNSDTYNISKYIDYFLNPLATAHPSYIKDTTDFLLKLSNIKPQPNSFLITLDVESLYTNINNVSGLKAVEEAFRKNPDTKRPDEEIIKLLSHSLKYNDFIFNNQYYLQTGGTAMGKKFAPNYANIFMAKWENEVLKKCPKQPQAYFRFLDDIFIIWPHSRDDLNEFMQVLNSHDENINLKCTISEESIDFLDVTVFKGDQFYHNGTLDSKVFFKPTDTHELLHKHSYHPRHTFKSIIKSQIVRFYRICTHKIDFDRACTTLFSTLKRRGYSISFLKKVKRDTIFGLTTTGSSQKCSQSHCRTCQHIKETTTIVDNNSLPIGLSHNLNCKSSNVIYMIQCSNCNIKYVGETSRKLKERINQHRSDINTYKLTPVAIHFTQTCPDISYFQVIPLEKVKEKEHNPEIWNDNHNLPLTGEETMIERLKIVKADQYHLLTREQYWIKRLKTLSPHGLNLRTEIAPPIPFAITFSDYAPSISRLVRTAFENIKLQHGVYLKHTMVTAYGKNKNLKDLLTSSLLK